MVYIFIIIAILSVLLAVFFVLYLVTNNKYEEVVRRLNKMTSDYHDLMYNTCVLTDKLEKIKELNLIDWENNGYYKELLSTNVE